MKSIAKVVANVNGRVAAPILMYMFGVPLQAGMAKLREFGLGNTGPQM